MNLTPRFLRRMSLPGSGPMMGRWPVARHMELYDVRVCPDCGHLVSGREGQHAARRYHEDLEEQLNGPPEWQDPGGYVVGEGPLPAEMTGARPSQDDTEDGNQ